MLPSSNVVARRLCTHPFCFHASTRSKVPSAMQGAPGTACSRTAYSCRGAKHHAGTVSNIPRRTHQGPGRHLNRGLGRRFNLPRRFFSIVPEEDETQICLSSHGNLARDPSWSSAWAQVSVLRRSSLKKIQQAPEKKK